MTSSGDQLPLELPINVQSSTAFPEKSFEVLDASRNHFATHTLEVQTFNVKELLSFIYGIKFRFSNPNFFILFVGTLKLRGLFAKLMLKLAF